ncbi:MAG: CoB--CoM heterodisulfide reductase iron-sulfur subunit A family protein [candidate division WOR-3 bacterium]|nr:CoB--CoM heterodisulfide reductase iron-sulfur subunit A family protein [candidate division WOR-3 bacterium]
MNTQKIGAVLVVGGGIGGIQASLDLANSGFKVYLIDSAPAIGGIMAMLDKTFPTNDCSMCIMAPKLVECARHLNIKIIPDAKIEGLSGDAGNFQVKVRKKARYIDAKKCTGCGECKKHCPIEVADRFNQGLTRRKTIYIDYPQAVPAVYAIDKNNCIGCGVCEKLCLAGAINYKDTDIVENINVGAIILSPGVDVFDPKVYTKFGYGIYKNVVTSLEFERILSASGPFSGHLLRPYEGKIPKKIAFIQCVGSRDPQVGKNYCSSVCCTYAIKEAIIAKEHSKNGLETTVFYMDIRTFGKGFEDYFNRAKEEYGVRFIRAGVSKIEEISETKNLILYYENEEGAIKKEEFDMVVLSVGLVPKPDMWNLSRILRVNLNNFNFCRTSEFIPVDTIRDGIFVCGTFAGPKDIPETVAQASAAAGRAMALLTESRGSLVAKKKYPDEVDVSNEKPRIGVFVCHCGINIGGYVNVPEVVEYVKQLPDVVYAENNLYTCSQDTQKRIIEKIREHKLNRVVVASCTPRTHEPLFRETIREAGLNQYLFEMANIRDQCSWIHMYEPESATEKAKDLVRMAVAKARLLAPLKRVEIDVIQKALVIGGGIAGMSSALLLAEQGFEVFLVEKENELGGNLRHIYKTVENRDVRYFLNQTIEKIRANKLIKVYTNARIKEITGFVGNYRTKISVGKFEDEEIEIEHGVVIVATGAQEYKPTEYLYGKDSRIITQRELEEKIFNHSTTEFFNDKTIVMIQCVGSRDNERKYCSRICCSQAIKNALNLLEINPDANIYILYKDIRTYGFKEELYRQAREKGIVFIRYDDAKKLELQTENGKLKIKIFEPILKEDLIIDPDLIVLSSGIIAEPNNAEIAKMLKVPINSDGFFLEAHVKLRPVDFATEGVFLAGMAHSPMTIAESIAQAQAAAARATTILSDKKYYAEATISSVNEELCAGCGMCGALCPYEAIVYKEKDGKKISSVNEALCKGCGTCVASCPSGAMTQYGFTKKQIMAMVEAL